ncbi:hypothetical protein Y695_00044 [Hydrogenophaga sp. T4]|jgi:hypothetical protein|nr:hypothetical protein Y695_00044 [Hydrogenophaga sp. T4]
MSQHFFKTVHNAKAVIVQMGFDRPLGHFYMTVYDEEDQFDQIYSYLEQEDAFGLTIQDFRDALADLGINVPESMFEQTEQDAAERRGNRQAWHSADGTVSDSPI